MFIDIAKITIKSGDGGNGVVSFHREKYVPRGGPDGGDGGMGGSVIFQVDPRMRTLLDFKYRQKYIAENGADGDINNRTGKNGADLVIFVPQGTIIKDTDGNVVADLSGEDTKVKLLRGGGGGRGNAKFATPTRQTPNFAQPGRKTKAHTIVLELKMIADVGFIGFPNVGKSTLLSVITSAKPKIANYHFTTLSPNLGVAQVHNKSFVIADIPGLIENAAEGAGLGHEFLRHIERTRLLVHVLDASGIEGRDPVEDYHKIRKELNTYSEKLIERPEIIAANKCDLPDAEAGLELLHEQLPDKKIMPISAATNQGISDLLQEIANQLEKLPETEIFSSNENTILDQRIVEDYDIFIDDHTYYVEGGLVDRLLESVNLYDRHSMAHFQKMLVEYGIIDKLREMGAKDGDTINMNDTEFDFTN
ncbi:MAG: GTPase ObgE [Eubacteriales bacterium]